MKTVIASSLILIASAASADWEAAWGTDELMINHEGISSASQTVDPIASSGFASYNSELHAGAEADGVSAPERTAYEQLSSQLAEYGA